MNIEIQRSEAFANAPSESDLTSWAIAALEAVPETELCIRLVDEHEIQQLNRDYRNKDSATNVLSFPVDLPEEIELPLLGDVVICAPVVEQEAAAQNKSAVSHWAHLVVHGVLHLQGYDHENDEDAETMEAKEIEILKQLGFKNPYTPALTSLV